MYFTFKFPGRKQQKNESELNNLLPEKERTQAQKDASIDASLRRTRREIADIVDCNQFDKFATFTFDPSKHPQANDYQFAKKKFVQWINKQQVRHGSFTYIVVPERQNNGNIHFHALLGGFTGKYHPTNKRGKGDKERQCYKIDSWEKSNGFADMEDIGNKTATGKYIGKYISKDLIHSENSGLVSPADDNSGVIDKNTAIQKKHEKRYFSSKGLKRPEKHYNTSLETVTHLEQLDLTKMQEYENDYVTVKTIPKKQ
jgi:hypothetical protein